MKYDGIIVGAGVAGLICAYKLAQNTKLNIAVLEKEEIAGRKLKASGNGKCNFTNKNFSSKYYFSNNKQWIDNYIGQYSYQEILQLFEEIGIACYEQEGYFYPISNQGKQVRNILVKRCEDFGVRFVYNCLVDEIKQKNNYEISVVLDGKKTIFYSDFLILATGGMAGEKLGGSESGYFFAKNLGIQTTDIFPALCPIYLKDKKIKMAKGVRVNGTITIQNNQNISISQSGQIQFNEDNISGICVMNLSGQCYQWMKKHSLKSLYLDLLPQYSEKKLADFFHLHRTHFTKESILDCLNCILPAALSKFLLMFCDIETKIYINQIKEKEIQKLIFTLKHLALSPIIKSDYDKAQVTGGGVDLNEIDDATFECKKYKNLYILGELLDVNGQCGGYNISFAILSAMDAANAIKLYAEELP